MEPITLAIIITLFALLSGGSVAAYRRRQEALHRLRLEDTLKTHHRLEDQRISLFEIFWDLGASDFALELMAHYGLLPEKREELAAIWQRLADYIEQHGSYDEFLRDALDAIQEFYSDHLQAGHRRLLPGLSATTTRQIPVPRRLTTELAEPEMAEKSQATIEKPTSASLRERRRIREGRLEPGLLEQGSGESIDIDKVADFPLSTLLESFLDGNLAGQFEKWWKLRKLRQKRQQLDAKLEAFYDFYAAAARQNPDFYAPLYDAHERWRDEANRLRLHRDTRPWKDKPYATSADLLYEQAIDLAEQLSNQAYRATYQTIESIHDHARAGRKAMAGYLIFLNRYAFFAGRHSDYARYVTAIEFATQRMREELIALRDQGLL